MTDGEAVPEGPEAREAIKWTKPQVMEGEIVRIEPLERRHVPDLALVGDDEEIWAYMLEPRRAGKVDVARFVDAALGARVKGERFAYAIVARGSGRAVGSTSYLDIEPHHGRIEIGSTWLGRAFWRSGANTEAKLLMLTHAFDDIGAHRVALKTDGRNLRSQAAILRLGAKKEGVLRRHMRLPDGYVRDTVYFSILRDEWPEVRRKLTESLEKHRSR